MPQLEPLLDAAINLRRRATTELDGKIAEMRDRLAALQSTKTGLADVDTSDHDAMLRLAASKLAADILPKQIEEVDSLKGDAMRSLGETCEEMRRLLIDLSAAEQEKVAKEIAALLEPYSMPMPAAGGGTFSPALTAAWSMPIISGMAQASNCQSRAVSESNTQRIHDPARFDSEMLSFADEVFGIVERYLSNGESFIPPAYRAKKR
jgi:hypothetical protein